MTTLTSRTFTAASDREAVSYVAALREGEQVALYATGATEAEDADAIEAAERAIQEDPLSVEVRDGWRLVGHALEEGPEEFRILLSTGGPACWIVGGLLPGGEPDEMSIRLQHQDWFQPWTDLALSEKDRATLTAYARRFYFED